MTVTRRSFVLVLVATTLIAQPSLAQGTGASITPPSLTSEEMERFLREAEIVGSKRAKKGVTDARQVTLFDGRVRHDAQLQDVDIALPMFDVGPKHTEINFKDT